MKCILISLVVVAFVAAQADDACTGLNWNNADEKYAQCMKDCLQKDCVLGFCESSSYSYSYLCKCYGCSSTTEAPIDGNSTSPASTDAPTEASTGGAQETTPVA